MLLHWLVVSWLCVFVLAGYSVQEGQLLVQSVDGTTTANYLFPTPPRSNPITLSSEQNAAISFTISPSQPKPAQVALLLDNVQIPLKLRKAGTVKYQLSTGKNIDVLSRVAKQRNLIDFSIIVAHPDSQENNLRFQLPKLEFDDSLRNATAHYNAALEEKYPAEWNKDRFSARQPIAWTFKPERTHLNPVISIVSTAITLVFPWIVFIYFVSQLPKQVLSIKLNPSISLFVIVLVAFEALEVFYWTSLTLQQLFLPASILSFLAFATGKNALSDSKMRRE